MSRHETDDFCSIYDGTVIFNPCLVHTDTFRFSLTLWCFCCAFRGRLVSYIFWVRRWTAARLFSPLTINSIIHSNTAANTQLLLIMLYVGLIVPNGFVGLCSQCECQRDRKKYREGWWISRLSTRP